VALTQRASLLRTRAGYVPAPGLRASRGAAPFSYADVVAPAEVDWRALGGVTAVKDQGQCGSCWAFSTTGSVEGANFATNGALVSLSEQELVDCDKAGNDRGCNGGLMDYAYEYIIKNGGLDTESDYPYSGSEGSCDVAKEHTAAVVVTSFEDIPANDEASIKKAVSQQPVSIAIAASGLAFQLYSHGVFDGACSTNLDHGVLVVGYGSDAESGKDFWIVKNSWGAVWGEQGFIKMAMNHSSTGLCGLAMVPSFPVVAKAGPPGPPTPPGPTPTPTPPPPPAGVTCDARTTCPAGSTCCCTLMVPFINMCLNYGCCPYESATCCTDGKSCCPADHPVCDLERGACTAPGNPASFVALGSKFAATKAFSRATLLHGAADMEAEEGVQTE
jgi:KDEL-tailed cysteine endopeptidase